MSAQPKPVGVGADGNDAAASIGSETLPTWRPLTLVAVPTASGWLLEFRRKALLVDLSAAAVLVVLVNSFRFGDKLSWRYFVLSATVLPAWVLAIFLAHGYERRFLGVGTEEYRAVVRAAVGLLATIALVSYAMKVEIARGFVILVCPGLLVVGLFGRHRLRCWLQGQREQGRAMQRTLVIGRADSAASMIREIARTTTNGMHVIGACIPDGGVGGEGAHEIDGVPIVGRLDQVISAVDELGVEVVAVSSDPDLSGPLLRRLGWALEERQVDLIVSPGIVEVAGPRLSIRPAAGLSLLHVERPVSRGGRMVTKALFDRVVGLWLILAGLPVLLTVAVLVKVGSPGPILFKQRRIGARGEPFDMLKFRTMVVDAEAQLGLLVNGHDGNEVLFKKRDDPRVTKVGRVLRRYSLDELPQLFNVLRGDMSLVGPRPPLPSEVAKYESDAVRRLRVKPGLTGLWQVSGRSNLSWEESLRLDLRYVDNWSLVLDLQILLRTARAVLGGNGAY
jgi:exopolysaccharide biosynthesis polyprenyl glycosylphosphotransferase